MLDAFIIDELRRREAEREDVNERPRLELPLHYESEGNSEEDDSDLPPPEDKDSVVRINFE